eukprot:2559018-Pleurochrysis_carterae.AAC.3
MTPPVVDARALRVGRPRLICARGGACADARAHAPQLASAPRAAKHLRPPPDAQLKNVEIKQDASKMIGLK